MKILFAGGGTLGPVTPLLAVAEAWRSVDPSVEFVWVGTPNGPDRAAVAAAGIRFVSLPVARLTRYPSVEWLTLPFNLFRAARGAWSVLKQEAPNLVATAGGYTGVPIVAAARMMGIHAWLHQQDVEPILSSKLCAPFCDAITVAFEASLAAFPSDRTHLVGNPVRGSMLMGDRDAAARSFGFDPSRPCVLVTGGGGGSLWINGLMETIGGELAQSANVIHLTGPGKMTDALASLGGNYLAVELLTTEMRDAMAAADVVVSRAGMGTITELAARRKAAVVIPLPNSPQEANARVLETANAAIVLRQGSTTPQEMLEAIRGLVTRAERRAAFGEAMGAVLRTNVAAELVTRLRVLAK